MSNGLLSSGFLGHFNLLLLFLRHFWSILILHFFFRHHYNFKLIMDYNYFETLKNKVGEMKSRRDHIGQDIQRMRSEEMSIAD